MDYTSLRKNNLMNFEKERKIREITKEPLNSKCLDCNKSKPEYISLNNAVFICKNCYRNNHQKFPPNISRIIKYNLKALSLKDLQYLYFGGNKKMLEFMKYEYPKLIKLSSFFVYKTVALEYYRNWLSYLVEGGNKPIKPDIEVAYDSIEDKFYNKNNYLSNNNNSDVITIDFINDCYNYNDKYNNSITNFINKKNPESYRGILRKNNINNNFKENQRLKYQTEKGFYNNLTPSSNLKEFLSYYKTINKNNYEKYVSNQNRNENFAKTQSNFITNKNASTDEENYFVKNRIKRMSQDNIIEEIDNNFDLSNNENNNHNNKIIRAFKTNNRIYMKPKHTFIKSFDKQPTTLDKQEQNLNLNSIEVKEVYNINKENETKMAIKVKREPKNSEKMNINNTNNVNTNTNANFNNNDNTNDNLTKKFNKNKIKVGGTRSKYSRKKISNNFSSLNKAFEEKDKNKDKVKNKEKIKENITNSTNNIIQDNTDTDNTKSNINEISLNNYSNINLNNVIFKKKYLNNNYYLKYDKKNNKNFSTVEPGKSEVISKNGVDTTRDDGKSYDESYDDTQNTVQSLPLNKSMRHFYSRYPRKMKRTKTNRRKFDDNKKKDKKEKNKYLKLKREKSEIIQSLKVLLKKKEQIKKENENNERNGDIEGDGNEVNNYKTNDNELKKKIFVNKIKNEELNRIIINENKRNRKKSLNDNEDNKKNKEYFEEKFPNKKIYVKQNDDLFQKEDKNSVRSKYKNRINKMSENL